MSRKTRTFYSKCYTAWSIDSIVKKETNSAENNQLEFRILRGTSRLRKRLKYCPKKFGLAWVKTAYIKNYCESSVQVLCNYYESTVKVPCKYCESTVQVLWKYCATIKVLWKYRASTMKLLWKYCASTVKVLWKYCESTVKVK